PEVWSTLEGLILSLLEKHPGRRPASGNLVALALFEEAERARRLERINPGLKRSDLGSPVVPPPSRTLTVGDRNAPLIPANGRARVDPGPVVMSALESPPTGIPRFSDNAGPPPSPPEAPRESPGSDRATGSGPCSHPIAREMLAKVLDTPIVISP